MILRPITPDLFIAAHRDDLRAVSLPPTGPKPTHLSARWLFLQKIVARPGVALGTVTDFATTVLIRDAQARGMNQRGLRSSRHPAGRLMPQTFGNHNFHRWALSRLSAGTSISDHNNI
jgi:hypothetical protein